RPYGPEVAKQHREPFRKDRQMGPGVTAVRLRDSLPERTAQRSGGCPVKTATARETSAAEAVAACSWIMEMCEKIRTQPQKYPDDVMEGDTLYRNIPHRAGSEDVATWKMCVPKALRETVLKENHDSLSAGHVGTRRTIARLAARYYWPGMHRDARAHVRKCE
ncbi:hypothetical protein KR084_007959, partial [Drosophila pseudotakahashii]